MNGKRIFLIIYKKSRAFCGIEKGYFDHSFWVRRVFKQTFRKLTYLTDVV